MIETQFPTNTLFSFLGVAAFPENVDEPTAAMALARMIAPKKYNVIYHRAQEIRLDNLQVEPVALSNVTATSWLIFIARVIGNMALDIPTNGGAPVLTLEGYGTELFPGVICHSGKNIDPTGVTVTGFADGSVMELLVAVAIEDDQVV